MKYPSDEQPARRTTQRAVNGDIDEVTFLYRYSPHVDRSARKQQRSSKPLLIDIVNPQPKSFRPSTSRMDAAKKTSASKPRVRKKSLRRSNLKKELS